jgi:hypothetical protein
LFKGVVAGQVVSSLGREAATYAWYWLIMEGLVRACSLEKPWDAANSPRNTILEGGFVAISAAAPQVVSSSTRAWAMGGWEDREGEQAASCGAVPSAIGWEKGTESSTI